jgi:hypothetical protein
MQDRAAIEVAGDQGSPIISAEWAMYSRLAMKAPDEMPETDAGAATEYPPSPPPPRGRRRTAAPAAAAKGSRAGSWQGPLRTGALPFSALDRFV